MGAAFIWFARALQWGGTAALGYFSNDLADWLGRVTGTKEQTGTGPGSGSKTPWYLVVIFFLVIGAALAWIVNSFTPKNKRV